MVKVSSICAENFQNSDMPKFNKGSLLTHRFEEVMFDKNFKRELNSAELAGGMSFKSLFCGFLGRGGGKLPLNHTKSAMELPEVRMLDIIENSFLTMTPQLLS